MRNTIAPVIINGGFRGNVIPGSAEATINFRTIPGTDVEALIREVKDVIQDAGIEVTMAGGAQAAAYVAAARKMQPSPEDNELYRALAAQARATWPTAEITPYLFQAGTDAGAWRSRGIPVYGIYPYPIDAEDLSRMHGNDERVSVASLEQGTRMIYDTLVSVAAAPRR
jgi:acetylornithine deacetylase/succinyl-diaminopimelate desuccinylase-like protein